MNDFIKIVEVGPRDGLQNEANFIETNLKFEFIKLLADSGLKNIEATSFVSPKWVPQMQDNAELLKKINNYFQPNSNLNFPVLVPNMFGLDKAILANAKQIAVFISASESFSQKNINCSIEQSLNICQEVIAKALANNIQVRGYISCCLGCPYEGSINPKVVINLAEKLFAMGVFEVSIGDTLGVGTAKKCQALFKSLQQNCDINKLAAHFHDTYGQALANIYASLATGVRVIDSSTGGLGGCPYAKGASGNVATEDVIYMLNGLGCKTGIDLDKLLVASKFIEEKFKIKLKSKAAMALLSN